MTPSLLKPWWHPRGRLRWFLYVAFCRARYWLYIKLGIWRELPLHWPKMEVRPPDDDCVDAFKFAIRSHAAYEKTDWRQFYRIES